MPQNAGWYVVGLPQLRRAMAAASVDVADLKAANAWVSQFVAQAARNLAPIGATGSLLATIRGSRQVGRAVVRAGSAAVPYAGNVHYGWNTRPDPRKGWRGGPFEGSFYIIDAAQQTESVWLEQYLADLDKIIDKIGASTP